MADIPIEHSRITDGDELISQLLSEYISLNENYGSNEYRQYLERLDQAQLNSALSQFEDFAIKDLVDNIGLELIDTVGIGTASEVINGYLYRLNHCGHIQGIENVLNDLIGESDTKQQGAGFQLYWLYEHREQVLRTELENRNTPGLQGIDVEMKSGEFVELKYWNFSNPDSMYHRGLGWESVAHQIEHDIRDQGVTNLRIIFGVEDNIQIPSAFRNNLEKAIFHLHAKYPHSNISLETYSFGKEIAKGVGQCY